MTRREFSVGLAGVAVFPRFMPSGPAAVVVLQAIAGAHLPATLTITTNSPDKVRAGVWELRTYRSGSPGLAGHFAAVFPRAGIRPLLKGTDGPNLTYLIPFESLTARDRAWTALNADPAWIKGTISARPRFQSYQFGLYRVV
jgi:hypothetical protein